MTAGQGCRCLSFAQIARHKAIMFVRLARFFLTFGLVSLGGSLANAQIITDREEPEIERSHSYISDTLRLSGILGAAHGVQVVCNGPSSQFWRIYMQELLDLEAPERGTQLRSAMARAFNNAYSREARPGRVCDERMIEREATLSAEGREIAEKLAAAYFPKIERDPLDE